MAYPESGQERKLGFELGQEKLKISQTPLTPNTENAYQKVGQIAEKTGDTKLAKSTKSLDTARKLSNKDITRLRSPDITQPTQSA